MIIFFTAVYVFVYIRVHTDRKDEIVLCVGYIISEDGVAVIAFAGNIYGTFLVDLRELQPFVPGLLNIVIAARIR